MRELFISCFIEKVNRIFIRFSLFRLCDEATSALDSTTEAEILNALKSLANNRTSVFVAHRLTTAMQCDEVLPCFFHISQVHRDGNAHPFCSNLKVL